MKVVGKYRLTLAQTQTCLLLFLLPTGLAKAVDWDRGANSSLWSDAANWNPEVVPGATREVEFSNVVSNYSVELNGARTVVNVVFGGDNGYTLSQDTLTVTAQAGFSPAILLNAPSSGSVTHTINSNVHLSSLAGVGITTNANSSLHLGGSFTTGSAFTKSGAGTLILSGAATPTGNTTITAGTLQIGNGGTTGSLAGNIANGGTLAFDRSDSLSYSGTISGSGALTKSGSGTLTLDGANTYGGQTTISGGTLQFTNTLGGGNHSGNFSVASGSTLDVSSTSAQTFSGTISGSGTLRKAGSQTLTLTGNNPHSGQLIIAGGNVDIGGGTNVTTFNPAGIVNAGNLIFNSTGNLSYSGVISGAGTLFKTSSGTLTLSGTNTYTGNTHLEFGTLVFSDITNFGSASGGFIRINDATLQWAAGNTDDISTRTLTIDTGGATFDTNGNSVLLANSVGNSGAGLLTKAGAGTLTLAANATHSGGYAVTGGTLQFGNGGTAAALNGPAAVSGGATLAFDRSDSFDVTTTISGAGNVAQIGDATLRFKAAQTFAGTLTIESGSVSIGAGSDIASFEASSIVNNGNLIFNTPSAFTNNSAISGTGTLFKVGSNTTTLVGAHTYSGDTRVEGGTLVFTGEFGTTLEGDFLLSTGTTLEFAPASGVTQTLSGNISGAGALAKAGSGTTVLSGASISVGATSITGGVLEIAGNTFVSPTVTVGGALRFNSAANVDYTGVLSGTGELIKVNTGSLTLSGSGHALTGLSSYVFGGALIIDNPAAGSFAALEVSADSSVTLTENTQLTAGIAMGNFGGNNTLTIAAGASLESGSATLAGSSGTTGTVDVNGGTWNVTGSLDRTGGFGASNANVNISNGGLVSAGGLTGGASLITRLNNGTFAFTAAATANTGWDLGAGGGTINTNGHTVTLTGSISGNGTLTKTGTGTLTLNATNTSTGQTIIAAGTLVANASMGDIDLLAGATLEGSGPIQGTLQAAGTWSPGNSPDLIDVDSFTLSPTANLVMEIGGTSPGSDYDQIRISTQGTLGGTLTLRLIDGYTPEVGDTFTLFDGPISGTFAILDLDPGATWDITNLYTQGQIQAIPEPSTAALFALGALGVLTLRRTRRVRRTPRV
ncbi:MAG: autotransporter-associated beta strand repeat-containing protein [Terrimicrobiaceae bacterium]|nr:autotransporter-associated beta strand repeat-containing protein [Terrimicrobiaceae bacterium]